MELDLEHQLDLIGQLLMNGNAMIVMLKEYQ